MTLQKFYSEMHWAPGTTQEFQDSEGYVVSKSLLDIRSAVEGYGV